MLQALRAANRAGKVQLVGFDGSPIDGKTEIRLELARHAIDMLDILEQKTKGNLTADEAAMLEGILHQLRLEFMEAMTPK